MASRTAKPFFFRHRIVRRPVIPRPRLSGGLSKNGNWEAMRHLGLISVLECIGRNLLFTVIGDWLLVSGIVGFFAMGLDKARAGNGDWRISEMTLYHFAGGGSLGVALGSCAFHHKTSKASFLIVLYGIVGMWIFAIDRVGFLGCLFSGIPHG